MIKVLVFDLTPAAVSVGDYIEKELPIEVIRVVGADCGSQEETKITGANSDLKEMVRDVGCSLKEEVARMLAPYIGEVGAIILANPLLVAKCGAYLEKRYPAQKFIFFGADLPEVIAQHERVSLLTTKELRVTEYYQMQKARCQEQEIEELDCERWLQLVKSSNFQRSELVKRELNGALGVKIIVNSAELMAVYDELEKMIDWRANLIDLREGIVAKLRSYFAMKVGNGRPGSNNTWIERSVIIRAETVDRA